MATVNTDQILQELLNMEVQMRKMLLTLDTSVTALEITPSGSEPPEVTPEKVELVSDKIGLTLKNVVAQYRKYFYLFPQRRQHVTRRSFREDSGFGSGIFNDDPAATEVCATPIQESQETTNTEKNSAVEHSEGNGKEVGPEETSATVPSVTEVTHV
ncbi:uncharacterized protein LOC124270598 [Haliotis rubra]|uniref:uncharacterized protein LOC124270598 n=1 Tax=Haliotis rubra TaxID=36100 RepID=UPI001EE62001|nr:uncharacterized protein LOC124270598 [Haliotis rubra]XP_046561571.1 uncharacterized protein LOC124270598 [Haliotis rubra]